LIEINTSIRCGAETDETQHGTTEPGQDFWPVTRPDPMASFVETRPYGKL